MKRRITPRVSGRVARQVQAAGTAPPATTVVTPARSTDAGRAARLGHRVVGLEAPGGAVQRDVQVKNGPTYAAAADLPMPGVGGSMAIRNQADAAETYLVKSSRDLERRALGQQAPMLTPHRHLIGENHNQSRFTDALADWGWGADKMAEGFQTSATVTDELSESLRRRRIGLLSNPYYQVKHLENFHAYMLSGLAAVIAILKELEHNSGVARGRAENVHQDVNVGANRTQFSQAEDALSRGRKNFRSHWADDVLAHLGSYEAASRARLLTARGGDDSPPNRLYDLAQTMAPKWDALRRNAGYVGRRPYGPLDGWQETATSLATYRTNVANFRTNGLEVFADALIDLTKSEAAAIPLGGNPDQTIDTGWQTATQDTAPANILAGGSDIREPFMIHNINTNLDRPGLVQIGAQHVARMAGQINHGKYHASYAAFVTDTLA